MSDAQDRGWGPGWPTNRINDMVNLKVDGASFDAGTHKDIHDLMEILLTESVDRGYIRLKDGTCWGYACRPIKNPDGSLSNTASNHSWGLAIDVNAPENCFGCSSHTIPGAMGDLWTKYGFRWGGDYSGTKDWMHFEYMESRQAAAKDTDRARGDLMQDDRLDKFQSGFDAYKDQYKADGGQDPGPPADGKPDWFKRGWNDARFAAQNPRGE